MSDALQIFVAPVLPAERFAVSKEAAQATEEALVAAAPIAVVRNAAENENCFKARKRIKSLLGWFESARKALKEPVIELGRQLDRTHAGAVEELEREAARLEGLEREFAINERNRVREEELAQERERQRIEAERQAEIKRAQDEAAEKQRAAEAAKAEADRIEAERVEKERIAEEAARAAEQATATAKSKKEKIEAAKLTAEAEQKQLDARVASSLAEGIKSEAEQKQVEAQQASQQTQLEIGKINDVAEALTQRESRPVAVVKARGQAIREEWEILSINEHALYRARPDLVRKIEFDMVALKAALDVGPLPGVVAKKGLKVGTRGGSMQPPAALAPPVNV